VKSYTMKTLIFSVVFFCMIAGLSFLTILYAAQPMSGAQDTQKQINGSQAPLYGSEAPKLSVKISFNILPDSSYFWAAPLSEDGKFSWAGLPSLITISVGIGGPVYTINQWTSMPFTINTGDYKVVGGSAVVVKVEIDSINGYHVVKKFYTFPVNNSVFNITLMGPSQPLVYKPVFTP